MKITELNYKANVDWEIDTKDMEYRKCKELPEKTPIRLRGFFTTPDNGYGRGSVAILDDCLLNMPQRYTETVDKIIADEEMVQEIKDGKVAIILSSFVSKKYKKIGYDVTFVEV